MKAEVKLKNVSVVQKVGTLESREFKYKEVKAMRVLKQEKIDSLIYRLLQKDNYFIVESADAMYGYQSSRSFDNLLDAAIYFGGEVAVAKTLL